MHDVRRRRLFLARDRLGIKPLFYARTAGALVFGSDLSTVLASGIVTRTLDVDALGEFLAWEYVPPPRTLIREVRKLDAAELLEVDLATGHVDCRSWWDVPLPRMAAEAKASGNKSLFWEAHYMGADKEYCHLERLTGLERLPASGFKLSCFPLKVKGGSAGPARVVAMVESELTP